MGVLKREQLLWLILGTVLILDFRLAWANNLDLKAARTALRAKEFQAVIDMISPKLDVAPREGFLILSKAYSGTKNHPMSLKTLNAALAKYKGDREIATELGRTHLALNKEREAKGILKEVIDLHPNYEPAYLAMAEIYEKRKNRYELRMLFQDLIENVGEKPIYISKLCDLATKEGLYELSFKHCDRAIFRNPKEPLNYINIATAYKETGKSEKAHQFFKKAADSFSKSEMALVSYAQYLDEGKNSVQSYAYWKKATLADAKSARAWLGLAFTELEIQKFSDSMTSFEKLCELDDNAERHLRRAAGQLKTLKQESWLEKMMDLIGKCNERSQSRKFL